MPNTAIQTHTLPGGLRVVHLQTPLANVAHFGVVIRAGAADEQNPEEYGLAHFVEHTIFKGTRKRNSWHIINRMEAVGGELNAFTTKVDTVVYTTFPKGSLGRAAELIFDLITESQFPESELAKECEVVCDEINSYLDSPSEAVYDEFEDTLYAGTPLGHNILGTEESVRAFRSDSCWRWLSRYYHTANMVAFYAGPDSLHSVLRRIEGYASAVPVNDTANDARFDYPGVKRFAECKNVDIHQAHTVMGCSLTNLDLKERVTLSLLTNRLGGPGMNSLLGVALREKRGLVYTVDSTLTDFIDTTLFTTYFGTDPCDNAKCIRLAQDIVNRAASTAMTERALAAAKKQYRGQLIVARHNAESRIMGFARSMLSRGYALTPAETDKLLVTITPADICAMAERLADLSTLTLCPGTA